MPRLVRFATAVGLLALVARGAAGASFLYLASEGPDEQVAFGRRLRLTDLAGAFHPYATDEGGLSAWVEEATFRQRYFLYFNPPAGQRFAPGPYDGAASCGFPASPGVCVTREGYGAPVAGHVDVVDAAYDGGGHLVRFAANFSQHGAAAGTTLTGAFRLASGDGGCDGAPGGAPCDDLDDCSPASACAGGVCVPSSTTACPGAAAGPCHDGPQCDPVGGACLAPTSWGDGISCASDDKCAFVSYCAGGVCATSAEMTCADYDPCTYDVCDTHAGCVFAPIPGVCGRPRPPGSFVFLRRTPTTAGVPLPVLLVPPNGWFVDSADDGSVTVSGTDDGGFHYWSVGFSPPPGAALAPGAYEDALLNGSVQAPGQAALSLSAPFGVLSCDRPAARFVVREIGTRFLEGDRGQALTFAADFELRCPDGSTLSGSVRIRSGDAACVGAPDGAPCDDLNACTGTSTCRGGACVAADPVACPDAGACRAAPLCDPATGACVDAPALPDGVGCDDPTTCTQSGVCTNGVCNAGSPPCDDANPCTVDGCAAGACVHDPIPECWLTASQTKLSAEAHGSLQGRDVDCGPLRCQRADRGVLLLSAVSYRVPGGETTCGDGTVVRVPDELGTVRRGRGGTLRLRPSNLRDVRRALGRCGRSVALSHRESLTLSADGRELAGVSRAHVTVVAELPIEESIVSHVRGRLGAPPEPGALPPGAHVCPERLVLRCVAR